MEPQIAQIFADGNLWFVGFDAVRWKLTTQESKDATFGYASYFDFVVFDGLR